MVSLFSREKGNAAGTPSETGPAIEQIVAERLVVAHFQPIVHLETAEVVGFEALTRGPAGTDLERPDALFATARAAGLASELDTIARAAAFRAVLDAGLHPSMSVFVNADPGSVGAPVPADLVPTMVEALARLRVFLDISEKALGAGPAASLTGIERARGAGWGISLDNVGLTADSLALMPFARPDVVKVDTALLHGQGHLRAPRIVGPVTAHRERTGAVTLAAGIETPAHVATAHALGATYGQGYLFGRPGPIGRTRHKPANPLPLIRALPVARPEDTPFRIAAETGPPSPAARSVVEALAADLEQRAALEQDPPVFLVCLPEQQLMSGGPLAYLQVVGRGASFAGAVCADPPRHPVTGVQVHGLAADDPLRSEWSTILIGPHHSVLLTARQDGPGGPSGPDGLMRYRLTYERSVVARAARILMARITS